MQANAHTSYPLPFATLCRFLQTSVVTSSYAALEVSGQSLQSLSAGRGHRKGGLTWTPAYIRHFPKKRPKTTHLRRRNTPSGFRSTQTLNLKLKVLLSWRQNSHPWIIKVECKAQPTTATLSPVIFGRVKIKILVHNLNSFLMSASMELNPLIIILWLYYDIHTCIMFLLQPQTKCIHLQRKKKNKCRIFLCFLHTCPLVKKKKNCFSHFKHINEPYNLWLLIWIKLN